jgi:hypothetical protein
LDTEFFTCMERFELAGAVIAMAFIPGEEFGTGSDDGDADMSAAMEAGIVISGAKELFADTAILLCGVDAEQTEVEPVALVLEVDATEEYLVKGGIFENGRRC